MVPDPGEASPEQLEARLRALRERGVRVVDPRQTYVDPEVDPSRIHPGVVLHPGTRLGGARTFLGPGARVATQGPTTLVDAVLGERAEVASGFVQDAVLLRDARVGPNGHVREGTLLEEQASTAHAVGLKHTILMSFVTLGSLINFCDALIAGGTSRQDHSEVGSGFIHFNYTPWGKRGDKATPSLVGDVVRGVFLREPRIFLGGSGGLVGPRAIGFGSVTAAGQVVRKDVADGRLVHQGNKAFDVEVQPGKLDAAEPRAGRNVAYIGQLVALAAWYRDVRLARVPDSPQTQHLRVVLQEALATLETCIQERVRRLGAFLEERGQPAFTPRPTDHPCPLDVAPEADSDHVRWVQGLDEAAVSSGRQWLARIVSDATTR